MHEENFAPEEFMLDDDVSDPTADPVGESMGDEEEEGEEEEVPETGIADDSESM